MRHRPAAAAPFVAAVRLIVLLVVPAAEAIVAAPALAQSATASRTGPRKLLPRDTEIALARSAAPPSVSAAARVLVLTDTGYVVAEPGSNGVTCLVDRSWSLSIEPHCHDAEASATIMRIHVRETELRHRGVPEAEIAREIAAGLASGRLRLPTRPALTYMMSAAQELYDDDGRPVGSWKPHLMLYYPWMTNAELGLPSTPDMRVGAVFGEGTPRASLVIVMPEFVPRPAVASGSPEW